LKLLWHTSLCRVDFHAINLGLAQCKCRCCPFHFVCRDTRRVLNLLHILTNEIKQSVKLFFLEKSLSTIKSGTMEQNNTILYSAVLR